MKAELQRILPKDVLVFTRQEIIERDRDYWISATSIGFMFTMGVIVSLVVGVVIVYQILYTDIASHMKQYATLKAMGYNKRFLFAPNSAGGHYSGGVGLHTRFPLLPWAFTN